MNILISSIIFAILYIAYVCWIYIKSSMLPMERFKSNEISIENIKMQQFFHFI